MARPREFDPDDALALASRLFWERGYQATSVRDLERATGLTAGSLYKAFGNKRDLFRRCLDRYMERDSYYALLMRQFQLPLLDAVRSLLDRIIDTADGGSQPPGCLVTNLLAELVPVDAELASTASAGLAQMEHAVHFRLKWAQERGDLSASADVAALASFLMVTIQGMLVLATSTKDVASLRRARDLALDALRRA